jgi:hypothetical protein
LVQGLVKAGKRFRDIINFMSLDDDYNRSSMRSSKSRKSRSRSVDRKRSKQQWVPVDESNQELLKGDSSRGDQQQTGCLQTYDEPECDAREEN